MKQTTQRTLAIIAEIQRIAVICPHSVADIWADWSGHVSLLTIRATAGRWVAPADPAATTDHAFHQTLRLEMDEPHEVEAAAEVILAELRAWLADDRGWSPEPLPDTSRPAAPAEVMLNATLTPLPDERRFQAASRIMSQCVAGHHVDSMPVIAANAVTAADALLAELDKPTKGQP